MRIDYVVRRRVSCIVLLALIPLTGVSQPEGISKTLTIAYDNGKSFYYHALGPELGLYSGVLYKEFPQHKNDEGQPYFDTSQWVRGDIVYNDIYYESVPLLYDVVNDKVITDHLQSAVKLELISEKIKYFVIDGHRFVPLTIQNNNSVIHTGFFELLYDGRSKLYVKWQKNRVEAIIARELQVQYEDQNKIYLNKENKFFVVKTKSSFLHLLEDKKLMLQKYIKKNRLNFKGYRTESMKKILAFYELGIE
jgi:hypothetical protein